MLRAMVHVEILTYLTQGGIRAKVSKWLTFLHVKSVDSPALKFMEDKWMCCCLRRNRGLDLLTYFKILGWLVVY